MCDSLELRRKPVHMFRHITPDSDQIRLTRRLFRRTVRQNVETPIFEKRVQYS